MTARKMRILRKVESFARLRRGGWYLSTALALLAATAAVLLFALPRVGVGRRAAFLAALAAALSSVAIERAQDSREYSVDALLAALILFGLLKGLRDGKTAVLCAALFAAPLVQYGLILFGCAILATAALFVQPPRRLSSQDETARRGLALGYVSPAARLAVRLLRRRMRRCLRSRDAIPSEKRPSARGVRGRALSGELRRRRFGSGIRGFSNLGGAELASARFGGGNRAGGGRGGGVRARARRHGAQTAVSAAVLGRYPLGDDRASVYLSPAIFVGFGFGLSWVIGAAALGRAGRLSPALFAAAAIGRTAVAADDARKSKPYAENWNDEAVLPLLKEHARARDLVYASADIAPNMRFYLDEKPSNFFFWTKRCGAALNDGCVPEIALSAKAMGRFYLRTAAVDERDLSDYARERGVPFDSFNFDFANEGSLFGGKCLIRARGIRGRRRRGFRRASRRTERRMSGSRRRRRRRPRVSTCTWKAIR